MIRMVQRRLIIPRGDTGSFSIPYLKKINQGDVAVFTIFDVMTHTKLFQKVVAAEGDVLNIAFSHNETVNLQPGKYLWDIKIYTNPQFVDDELVNGEEIDSYYAGFSLPECEIRETGDSLLMSDDTPQAKLAPDQIDLISAAITATQTAKEVAMNSATDAETSASAAASSAQAALDSKDAALASQTSAATSESNAAESAAAAQVSATQAAQIAQQIHEEIPTKVSDLVDDSGHYTKPATGIPASDLEETYLTEHQDLSNYVQKTDYATRNSAGIVKISPTFGIDVAANILNIARPTTDMLKAGNNMYRPVVTADQHTATFYGLAKAAGSDEKNSELPVGQYTDEAKAAIQAMLDVPSTADIPTNVSELTNDAGYLTEHQDISGKANSADLAAVATSGSYEDLSDKPTIPEVPVQDVQVAGTSIVSDGVANIPKANSSTFGVVKIDSTYGIGRMGTGALTVLNASQAEIKDGASMYRALTPIGQHTSTFYGLAKAAGDTTQSQSDNAVGAYTDSAKAAIQTMLDVPSNAAMTTAIGNAIGNINSFDMAVVQALPAEDISTHTIYLVPKTGETNDVYDEYVYINDAWEMVGNTQIDLSNYVTFNDIATRDNAGIAKYKNEYGLYITNDGYAAVYYAPQSAIKRGTEEYRPVVPANQHQSIFYGLAKAAGDATQSASSNAVGTYTNEAKAAIRSMIGAAASADVTVQDVQVNGTSVLNDGVANVDAVMVPGTGVGSAKTRDFEEDGHVYTNDSSGMGSFAEGLNTSASGTASHAEGQITYAVGPNSHAEGVGTQATGLGSHAEGYYTIASGNYSHAEGAAPLKTIHFTGEANATKYVVSSYVPVGSFVVKGDGEYISVTQIENVDDVFYITLGKTLREDSPLNDTKKRVIIGSASGIRSHTEGKSSIAIANDQHVEGKNNEVSPDYAHIVGNGSDETHRSNAYALDWSGNGHYMGNIYVGANADSTGGTKVLCEADFATAQDIQNIINGGAGA